MTGSEEFNSISSISISEISTIVIALSAFLIAMWQAFLSKSHNLLSIQPAICSWRTYDYDFYNCEIINKGSGVAVIKKFNFYIQGKEVSFKHFQKDIRELVKNKDGCILSDFNLGPDSYLAAGEKFNTLNIQFKDNDNKDFIKLFRDRYTLEIKYQCLYGRKFSFKKSL